MIELFPVEHLEWMERAVCAQSFSGDLHFPESGQAGIPPFRREVDAAIAMCGGCPVRDECRAYAEELNPEWGIWGGLDYSPRGRMGRMNAAKTHCPQSHEYTPENTRHSKSGRKCRACDAITTAKRRGKAA